MNINELEKEKIKTHVKIKIKGLSNRLEHEIKSCQDSFGKTFKLLKETAIPEAYNRSTNGLFSREKVSEIEMVIKNGLDEMAQLISNQMEGLNSQLRESY